MKWPMKAKQLNKIKAQLEEFAEKKRPLPGVANPRALDTLAQQMIASLRRLEYTNLLMSRDIAKERIDTNDPLFDPEKAIIWHARNNDLDEAVWLLFLSTHFGKHGKHGWRRLRDVYSGLGNERWTWKKVTADVTTFRIWLDSNKANINGAFGNHRKYESLNGLSPNGTGASIASYLDWIGPKHSHARKFGELVKAGGNDPEAIFDRFYSDMNVLRFGRLGKFDFLALLGRLDLAPIIPGKAYLKGATGPLAGARLLFGNKADAKLSAATLEIYVGELDAVLGVSKQVMEDSLCNWQKSPTKFVHFTG